MPGVARLCEEAQIREAKLLNQGDILLKTVHVRLLLIGRMGEHASQENGLNSDVKKEETGFSHGRQSSFITSSVFTS